MLVARWRADRVSANTDLQTTEADEAIGGDALPARGAEGRFVWPPRRPPGDGGAQTPQAPSRDLISAQPKSRRAFSAIRRAIHEIEETWLGVARRSFAARAAAEGWIADTEDSYCARCGTTVGPHEADAVDAPGGPSCPHCREQRLAWARFVRLGEYTGILRDAVHDLKFTAWRRVGRELGRELGKAIAARLDAAGIPRTSAVLVPVPTTMRRRLSRGLDHTLVLARAARRETGIPIVRALARSHRPSQLEVPQSARRANVARSMRPRITRRLAGKVVIVVDDVVTTGATMTAACRAIQAGIRKKYGTKLLQNRDFIVIWAACLGRTPDPRGGVRAQP